jgi:hypothetical protein
MSTQLVPQDKINAIRAAYAEVQSMAGRTLEKAIKLGGMFAEVHSSIPHGEWLPWLEQNLPQIPDRTVRRYIQLWENRETIRDELQIGHGDRFEQLPTIREALALIGKPKKPKRKPGRPWKGLSTPVKLKNPNPSSETPGPNTVEKIENSEAGVETGVSDQINYLSGRGTPEMASQEVVKPDASSQSEALPLQKIKQLSDAERKNSAECETIIKRGLPEAKAVAEAIDQLSPFKLDKNLEIEANRLFTAFISDLSTPLRKAVARIMLTWAPTILESER